jgi:hypothetical protein
MKTALKIATAVALVMGGLLTGACGGALTDTKPSAFVEQFNQTVHNYVSDTDLEVKRHWCEPDRYSKRKCVYTGAFAEVTLNTRKNGTVWRVEIRSSDFEKDEDHHKAFRLAVQIRCRALIEQTSGLGSDDAYGIYKNMIDKPTDHSSDKEVGDIHTS